MTDLIIWTGIHRTLQCLADTCSVFDQHLHCAQSEYTDTTSLSIYLLHMIHVSRLQIEKKVSRYTIITLYRAWHNARTRLPQMAVRGFLQHDQWSGLGRTWLWIRVQSNNILGQARRLVGQSRNTNRCGCDTVGGVSGILYYSLLNTNMYNNLSIVQCEILTPCTLIPWYEIYGFLCTIRFSELRFQLS